jgi:hypothetical protein
MFFEDRLPQRISGAYASSYSVASTSEDRKSIMLVLLLVHVTNYDEGEMVCSDKMPTLSFMQTFKSV